MSDLPVVVGSSKQPPERLSDEAKALWNSAGKVYIVGEGLPVSWRRIRIDLKEGGTLLAENIMALSQLKTTTDMWYNTLHRVESLLEQGVTVVLLEEDVWIRNTSDETYKALKAVANQEYAKTQRASQKRNEALLKRPSSDRGGSGWIMPDETQLEKIRTVVASAKTLKEAARKLNTSRTSLYKWRDKGLIEW